MRTIITDHYESILAKNALDSISEGVLITGHDQLTLYSNAAFTQITGYGREEMLGRNCNLLQGPGTDPKTPRAIANALLAGESFRGEILNYRKDGSSFWNDLSIAAIRDKQGKITHFVSVQRDITLLKKQEAELRIAAQAFDVDEGIMITDAEHRIVRVNRAFCRLTGYAPEEVLGKLPGLLNSGRQDRDFYARMWTDIREQDFWCGEIWNRRKSGDIYPEWLTISVIRDPAGVIQNYVAFFQDITSRKAQEEQLNRMAFHDSLTDLFNRHALDQETDRAILRAKRIEKLLALCMLDLDGFKSVNDTYGHEAGDEVLVAIGKRLPDVLRRTDFVARLGGDEFVVLLEYLNQVDELDPLLAAIEAAVRTPIQLGTGETVSVGVSMGVIVHFPGDADTGDGDALLRLADQALYAAKAQKENRERSWVRYGEQLVPRRHPLQELLRHGGLEVWYQPILDNQSRQIVGVEALARLRDSSGQLWMPGQFLQFLDHDELMILNRGVVQQSMADIQALDRLGLSVWVSVNIDPRSISDACVECVRDEILNHGFDPARITLEILEGNDFHQAEVALGHLEKLRKLGVRLALDDVGSAYSSLLRIKELPIDKIKLDQGFVRTLEDHPEEFVFVRAIQELSIGLGVDLIVEGVETDDILDVMTVLQVHLLQGYGIAKPMPFEDLKEFLMHPPGRHRDHPVSLLGFYAEHSAHYAHLKKTLADNPGLLDVDTLADACLCAEYRHIRRLVPKDSDRLIGLHAEIHRQLALVRDLALSTSKPVDWTAADQASEAMNKEILDRYREQKAKFSMLPKEATVEMARIMSDDLR